MESRWDEGDASRSEDDDLALRVYTSRLLGQEEALVLHGGGNTSVKSVYKDFFDRPVSVLYVKGSGWDLKTIEKPGFAPLRLDETRLLAERESLSDDDMAAQLRNLLLDQTAPAPSVEAILHAIMPAKFVDHTHTDAIVTLTNHPRGDAIMAELFPDCLILPYIMPGFVLARQVAEAVKTRDVSQYKGIVLSHHGVFTFSDDARVAYEGMIELVSRAEAYIQQHGAHEHPKADGRLDLLGLARIRRQVSAVRGRAQLAVADTSPEMAGFAGRPDVAEIATRGPITPDHVIRTKRVPVILEEDVQLDVPEVERFASDYEAYFQRNATDGLTMLDAAPRWGVWRGRGALAFGSSLKECGVISDIARHTQWAIQVGEALGGWQALPEAELFELEYWILEQAKLGKQGAVKPHQGKVAVITGAAGGIGRATCERLHADGAVVVGLDIDPSVEERLAGDGLVGRTCDVTDEAQVSQTIDDVVAAYGGLDILVCNAGVFQAGDKVQEIASADWDRALAVNLTAVQRLLSRAIPYLKCGVGASVVVVGSRNVTAPGAGAASYSVSKAGLTQLARVAALELAEFGVRVNTIHPDAVFDTGLWTDEALERSARRYGMSVDEYKKKNLLGAEIGSEDVAQLISTLAGDAFAATTGAQLPIDGGSDRVI
jgi:rhamnose utilization protein RhaD (predicted bifunctional aldolase and dehydrogenase)/NAD(P)-dependent dehydrogenase (short-subunit alcohol dehydrogenase family)